MEKQIQEIINEDEASRQVIANECSLKGVITFTAINLYV